MSSSLIKRLLRDDRGATAIEYGLILALIAMAILVAVQGLGGGSLSMWSDMVTKIEEART